MINFKKDININLKLLYRSAKTNIFIDVYMDRIFKIRKRMRALT